MSFDTMAYVMVPASMKIMQVICVVLCNCVALSTATDTGVSRLPMRATVKFRYWASRKVSSASMCCRMSGITDTSWFMVPTSTPFSLAVNTRCGKVAYGAPSLMIS